jgi:hypothetical protein
LAFFAWVRGRIYSAICGLSGSWPPLQIHRHEAFGLALQAGIAHRRQPAFHSAIVFKPPIFHRLVKALAHIVQDDPRIFIARHRKPDIIGTTFSRQAGTPVGIAEIAEIAQLSL